MEQDDDIERIRQRIRRLASEGAPAGLDPDEAEEVELLAALEDGTIDLVHADQPALGRVLDRIGVETVCDALEPEAEGGRVLAMPPRPWHASPALRVAALLAVALGLWALLSRDGDRSELLASLEWPGKEALAVAGGQPASGADPGLGPGEPRWGVRLRDLPEGLDPEQVERMKLATVLVETDEGYASGVLLDREGWVLTSYRALAATAQGSAARGQTATVGVRLGRFDEPLLLAPGAALGARRQRLDPARGLGMVRLEGRPARLAERIVPPLAESEPAEGAPLYLVGSSAAEALQLVETRSLGAIDYPRALMERGLDPLVRQRSSVLRLDAPCQPGYAGAPVFTEQGGEMRLAGIVLGGAGKETWCVRLGDLQAFASERPERPEAIPFDPWFVPAGGRRTLTTLDLAGGVHTALLARIESDGALAFALFIGRGGEPAGAGLPHGLWGAPDVGSFRFEAFVHMSAEGRTRIGTTGPEGNLERIWTGRSRDGAIEGAWERDAAGRWSALSARDRSTAPEAWLGPEQRKLIEDGLGALRAAD